MNRLFLAGFLGVVTLLAQPPAPGPDDASGADDPPSRVARLNWISGDVAFQPATVDDWTNATLNYPLTTGDHLFLNAGGRAELHIDGNAIRLNSNSNFGFLNLDDKIAQISLSEGSIQIRLLQLDRDSSYEIDTPNGAVTLLRAGDYRIDTDPARNITLVTVRNGQAEMYQDGNSVLVTARQTVRFSDAGPEVNPQYPDDDFDRFATSRNDAEDALPRGQDVSDSMTGAEDLYAYGKWDDDPLYGRVWMPPVDSSWTPYSTGRWAFVEPWGWTWVDDAPWGFAPFHYGRWIMARGGWVWIPGARTYRPVYAPALVGFIGGGGFGVSIGWFPLGPREPWVPSWGASRRYVERVNVMNVGNVNINVTNINYVNRERVTVISQADFAGARPVRGSSLRYSPAQIRDAQVIGSGPRIIPGRGSVVIGPARQGPVFRDRPVVARTPPPPSRVSFQAQQQLLRQNDGQPLRARQLDQLRGQQPAAVVQRQQVREIGNPQQGQQATRQGRSFGNAPPAENNPPATNRPPDRMNSRPFGAQPAQAAPPLRNSPAQPEVQRRAEPQTQTPPARTEQPQAVPQGRPGPSPRMQGPPPAPQNPPQPQSSQPPATPRQGVGQQGEQSRQPAARQTNAPRRKPDPTDDKR